MFAIITLAILFEIFGNKGSMFTVRAADRGSPLELLYGAQAQKNQEGGPGSRQAGGGICGQGG